MALRTCFKGLGVGLIDIPAVVKDNKEARVTAKETQHQEERCRKKKNAYRLGGVNKAKSVRENVTHLHVYIIGETNTESRRNFAYIIPYEEFFKPKVAYNF